MARTPWKNVPPCSSRVTGLDTPGPRGLDGLAMFGHLSVGSVGSRVTLKAAADSFG